MTGQLTKLRQAIVDNSGGDAFWIGEILLDTLERETGFKGGGARPRSGVQCASDPEASLPTYGNIPWDQLGRDVVQAQTDRRHDFAFDPDCYPGHQMVGINFNSLARIVDKYRLAGSVAQQPVKSSGVQTAREALQALLDDRRIVLGSLHRKRITAALAVLNSQPWPNGCHDPASCSRHKACMYIQCSRYGDTALALPSAHSPCEAGK